MPSQETKLPSKKFPVPPDTSDGILHYLTDYIEYIKDLGAKNTRLLQFYCAWVKLNFSNQTPSRKVEWHDRFRTTHGNS
jgi:hypothetical protein